MKVPWSEKDSDVLLFASVPHEGHRLTEEGKQQTFRFKAQRSGKCWSLRLETVDEETVLRASGLTTNAKMCNEKNLNAVLVRHALYETGVKDDGSHFESTWLQGSLDSKASSRRQITGIFSSRNVEVERSSLLQRMKINLFSGMARPSDDSVHCDSVQSEGSSLSPVSKPEVTRRWFEGFHRKRSVDSRRSVAPRVQTFDPI
eukprot:TRINITY_DN11672_c0_g2_i1.p1 TRINITY_DN11672_c0_g2~~TRINITY_DN11672_c0_g2_i1.p1  ORF type:complete len:202 (-),score=31.86 TRINITY_DN11672_c0_g2_i1:587-1192(-)